MATGATARPATGTAQPGRRDCDRVTCGLFPGQPEAGWQGGRDGAPAVAGAVAGAVDAPRSVPPGGPGLGTAPGTDLDDASSRASTRAPSADCAAFRVPSVDSLDMYLPGAPRRFQDVVVLLDGEVRPDTGCATVTCCGLGGDELISLSLPADTGAGEACGLLEDSVREVWGPQLDYEVRCVRCVLPDGRELSDCDQGQAVGELFQP